MDLKETPDMLHGIKAKIKRLLNFFAAHDLSFSMKLSKPMLELLQSRLVAVYVELGRGSKYSTW